MKKIKTAEDFHEYMKTLQEMYTQVKEANPDFVLTPFDSFGYDKPEWREPKDEPKLDGQNIKDIQINDGYIILTDDKNKQYVILKSELLFKFINDLEFTPVNGEIINIKTKENEKWNRRFEAIGDKK